MGWYHAEQLLAKRCPSARLDIIVEPFYMQPSNSTVPGYNEFHTWKNEKESKDGIQFYSTIQDIPLKFDGNIRMGIISARTTDNPSSLNQCIQSTNCKFHTILLEKPGAPTVSELINMRNIASNAGVNVYMGFNKNVSSYVDQTLQYVATTTKEANTELDVTFYHNNAYKKEELAECFERNNEGILKNMAIHELAILVTYYNVTMDNIASVIADTSYSNCQTLIGPQSGKIYTDFDKIKFKIITKNNIEINIAADRCGGNDSIGIIQDHSTGQELLRYTMPNKETIANIPYLEQLYPNAMPYFFTQDPDYCTLKERIAKSCLTNDSPMGVATIDTAITALQLAEYLTPLLQEQLLSTQTQPIN
jgi:predicted dehydrogenase